MFGDRPEVALRPEHASKSREEIRQELGVVVALRDVSFAVSSGEVFVVMGLSGSGKSTLVRCLIRLTEASVGQIYFDGEDIGANVSSSTTRCFRTATSWTTWRTGWK